MPGLAKTDHFLLSTATVMLGPMDQLHQLNPAKHAIGLVKNFQMSIDPQYVELTQGLTNSVVMSVRNGDGLKASMEVYEYTPRNLAYGAGLDASDVSYDVNNTLWATDTSAAAGATTVTIASDVTSDVDVGNYVFLQSGTDDIVHIAKVLTAVFATGKTTITFASGFATPTGVTFPVGTRVGVVKRIDLATGALFQPYLAAKIVGLLPKNNEPFTILLPKVKITKGMSVAFQSDNFGNLPFEFSPYNSVTTDPMYAEYGAAAAVLFPR